MPTGNEQLVVQLEARIRDFEKQMARASATADRQVAKIEKRFMAMNPKIAGLGRSMFGEFARGAALTLAPILSVGAAVRGANAALAAFGDVSDNAKAAGLDAEFFQGIAHQAQLGGVEIDALSGALATFAKNSGLAVAGRGKMVTALKALDPALIESIRKAATQEERVRLVADALSKETDAAKRAAIATAAFGDIGPKLANVFSGGAAEIDTMMVKARELGLIVDRELIARADELGDSFDTTQKIVDLQLKQALVNLGPTLIWLTGLAGDIASQIGHTVDGFNSLDRQSSSTLEGRLAGIKTQLAANDPYENPNPAQIAGIDPAAAASETAAIMSELRKRAIDSLRTQLANKPPVTPDVPTLEEIDQRNRAAQAAIDQAQAVKQLIANLEFEQAQVGRTSLEQAIATAQRQAGAAATDEQRARIAALITATDSERTAIEANTAAMEAFSDTAKSALGGFIEDLISGKSLAESLGDVLSNVGNRLLNAGLDSLFSPSGANLFNLPGRATGGPVSAGQPYIVGEKRPEVFVPNTAGRIVPRVGGLKATGGTNVSVTLAPVIDARGADSEGLARVERQLAKLKSDIPHVVIGTVRNARERRML